MPEAWTETLEQFSWEGRLGLAQLGMLGGVVALLLVWFAWRESRLIRRPVASCLFLGLRLATLVLVLWALAEPTDVLTEKKHQPRSIGIFLDSSASMTLVDPGDGSGDRLRWREALSTTGFTAHRHLEEAHGALAAAVFNLARSKAAAKDALEFALDSLRDVSLGELNLTSEEMASLTTTRTDLLETCLPALETSPAKGASLVAGREAREALRIKLGEHAAQVRRLADLAHERVEKMSSAPGKRSRLEKAIEWLEQAEVDWLAELGDEVRIHRFHFQNEAVALGRAGWTGVGRHEPDPDRGTDETSWMKQSIRLKATQQLDAALIVTDGVHNTGDSPRELAPGLKGVATMLVPIGDTRLRRDVFLHHVKYPQSVIQKDTLVVEAIITAHDCQREKLVVQLQNEAGETLDEQTLQVAGSVEDHRVSLRWKAMELGTHALKMLVQPVSDEFSEENNEAELRFQVVDDELRILLAERLPRWEFRYLKSLLQRDKRTLMDAVLFKPGHTYRGRLRMTPRPKLPADSVGWNRYRIVVLGDLTPAELTPSHQRLLRQWVVEAGGNLIVVAGESMPGGFVDSLLGELLPVENRRAGISRRGYQLKVTAEGASAPPVLVADDDLSSYNVWQRVSTKLPVYDLSPYSIPKPTSRVLIQADGGGGPHPAFLSWHYVGKGRVVYLAAPVAYQLRFSKGDEYHHRFWGQLFRWAIGRDLAGGSRTVKFSTDKTRYPHRAGVSVRLRLNEVSGLAATKATPRVVVKRAGEMVQTVNLRPERGVPGVYRATLTGLPPGKLRLEARGRPLNGC